MKFTITDISKRQRGRLYKYKKQRKWRNVFILKNPDTLQKARQFLLRFYIQKARHFTLCNFHEKFEVGIYIQKS